MTHILNGNLPSKTILLPNYIYTKCSCLFQSNHRKRNKTPLKMQFSWFVITFQHTLLMQKKEVQLQCPDKTVVIVFSFNYYIIKTLYLLFRSRENCVLGVFCFLKIFSPSLQRKAVDINLQSR